MPARAADPALQQAVLAEVNAFRTSQGRAPLRLDPRLSHAASRHAQDMLAGGRLTHVGRDGSDAGTRVARAGYRWRSVRENVAVGPAEAREVTSGWIRSPGHRANMLAHDVTEAGIGFAGGPGAMAGDMPRLFWTLVLAAPR